MSKKTTKNEEVETVEVVEIESTEGLVQMHKDGEHLHVHPTTVESHKQAGWKVA